MSLELTGERTLPGIWHENYWFQRHVVAYRFAQRYCRGARVMDAGCGEGYGTALLAEVARRALGVELVAEVASHAAATYPQAWFAQADLCRLPLPAQCLGTVVSLQVIEHLPDIGGYLAETARVLRPGGIFVCATPNRLTFTPGGDGPVNPFHTVEFAPTELHGLLGERFADVALYGVSHGARLAAVELEQRARLMDLLAAGQDEWPEWLRTLVAGVGSEDFVVAADGLDASLDLVAVAHSR